MDSLHLTVEQVSFLLGVRQALGGGKQSCLMANCASGVSICMPRLSVGSS